LCGLSWWVNALGRDILQQWDGHLAAEGVAGAGAPGLGDDVELAVAKDVADDGLVAAEVGVQDDVLLPGAAAAIQVLPDVITRGKIL
jgi:hypothetical protein